MTAFTAQRVQRSGMRQQWPRFATRASAFVRDFGVVMLVMALYFLARGQAPARIDQSVTLTDDLVRTERALHVYWEPGIQHASIGNHWIRETANFTYAYLHFPVMAAVGVWLWHRNREAFRFFRSVLFISMAIGIVFYYLLPAAPPRLMALHGHDLGFTDTVFGGETAVSYAQPSLILNEYAAIPSFHFGWIFLSSVAIWTQVRWWPVRSAAVGLTLLMSWAIVASANHLFIDMALGGLVICASWQTARWLHAPRTIAVPSAIRQRPNLEWRGSWAVDAVAAA